MAVISKVSNSKLRPCSLYLDRILKTQQNLSKSSPKIWKQQKSDEFDDPSTGRGYPALTLSHPLLRILESSAATPHQFDQIHAQLIVSGLSQHPLSAGRAIKKLCRSPASVGRAISLFAHLDQPDAFICNTILRSFLNSNHPEKAIAFYWHQMPEKQVLPNHYTFPLLAKTCAQLGLIQEGEKTHALIEKSGLATDLFVQNSLIHMYFSFGWIKSANQVFDVRLESDLVTWNSMVDGYAKNGWVDVARRVFDEMPQRDLVSWNSMIAGYVGIEDMESAKELFDNMPVRDIVSWNSMIDGYAKVGEVTVARELFEQMNVRNVVSWNTMLAIYIRRKEYSECLTLFDRMMTTGEAEPNEAILVSVLAACTNQGMLDRGKWVHSFIKDNQRIEPDVLLSTALLTMYAKCGDIHSAREIFDAMPEKSVVSWNSLIMGYAIHGQGEKALEMFLEMEKRGPRPNEVTFICVLSACTHGGLVLEGWWYFNLMCHVYKIEPNVEHYGCMVDLLGRAGLLSDSEEIINQMPMKPAAPALWGALLSACRTHSNFELGETVGRRLIELEPRDVGPYVLLSNIYASAGRWDDVEKVRKLMKEKRLLKNAGFSLVDLDRSVHGLFAEDNSAHKKSMVYSMLSEMGTQMKLSCREILDKQTSIVK
ncbi:hypothetical protein AAC387_Pa08g0180 [Persea americana]